MSELFSVSGEGILSVYQGRLAYKCIGKKAGLSVYQGKASLAYQCIVRKASLAYQCIGGKIASQCIVRKASFSVYP